MKKVTLVGRDVKTGRFISLKDKAMYTKEVKAPKAETSKLELVDAKPKVKVKEDTVEILKAVYGVDATVVEVDTAKVRIGKKVSNRMAGADPAPKVKKSMTVTAVLHGKEIEKTFSEGEIIEF